MTRPALAHAPARAIGYGLAAVCLLSLLDVCVKWLTADYSISQIGFLRYIVGIGAAIFLAHRRGGLGTLRTHRPLAHALRAVLNIATMLIFFTALSLLPIANATALGFVGPLFMTLLSIPLLGERVGPRRWAALAVGFAGMLVMLRPTGEFRWATLLPVVSAFTYALAVIASRQLSRTESTVSILFYYSLGVLAVCGAMLPWQWHTPSWQDGLLFLLTGITGTAGQLCLTQAFRYGEVSMLAPLEYTSLVWTAAFGYLLWDELPGWQVLAGAALVIASSLYIARREARRRPPEQPA